MRMLAALAALAALAPTAASAETWLAVAKANGHASYADPDAIAGDEREVTVREMKIYDPPLSLEGKAVRARIVNYRFDCETTRFKILSVENLDLGGASVDVIPITEDFREPAAQGTVGERLAAFGCGAMAMDPMAARTREEAIADGLAMLEQ
ncbi:MAG TPA: surface-adhesin E family protein [Caulobacter sp.]|nr:surface-adhesin E family protein [Caulobacter sp.]